MTVIIRRNDCNGSRKYHTTACRVVWQIEDKQYWTQTKAKKWGYTECAYCADEHKNNTGEGRQTRRELLKMKTSECRECGKALGAGYLCDECDTAEGWPE